MTSYYCPNCSTKIVTVPLSPPVPPAPPARHPFHTATLVQIPTFMTFDNVTVSKQATNFMKQKDQESGETRGVERVLACVCEVVLLGMVYNNDCIVVDTSRLTVEPKGDGPVDAALTQQVRQLMNQQGKAT
uniref:Uncharacterized protein n=1 Tax=Sexangularia sp. CB-2014 TaxID=1486929 RepID=A0A7S1VPN9_9EUKA